MADEIKIRILQCGSMCVPADCLEGGKHFYLPQGRAFDARREELPVFCFLIVHPRGKVLFDTGWSRELAPHGKKDTAAAARHLGTGLAAFYQPELPPGMSAAEQLSALNIPPEELDYVLLSHLDPAHVSGLSGLWGAKHVLCSQEDYWWSCRTVYRLRQPRRLWLSDRLETFWYNGTELGPGKWSYDLFGDGSMELVNLPGHTDGMFGLRISRGGRFVLLVSDAAYSPRAWEKQLAPGFGFNPKAQLRSLQWIYSQSRESGCAAVFSSHDRQLEPGTSVII